LTRAWVPEVELSQIGPRLQRMHLVAQLGEGLIILKALLEPDDGAGWRRHPCVRMFRGYERFFAAYGIEICREHRRRGYEDRCLPQYVAAWRDLPGPAREPWWWGRHVVHAQDRATLVARKPEWYGPVWPDVEPLDHVDWPVPLGR
jgi:hypothetical protein